IRCALDSSLCPTRVSSTLSLLDALPICADLPDQAVEQCGRGGVVGGDAGVCQQHVGSRGVVGGLRWTSVDWVSGRWTGCGRWARSEEHTSELQSREKLVCRRLLEKKKTG